MISLSTIQLISAILSWIVIIANGVLMYWHWKIRRRELWCAWDEGHDAALSRSSSRNPYAENPR